MGVILLVDWLKRYAGRPFVIARATLISACVRAMRIIVHLAHWGTVSWSGMIIFFRKCGFFGLTSYLDGASTWPAPCLQGHSLYHVEIHLQWVVVTYKFWVMFVSLFLLLWNTKVYVTWIIRCNSLVLVMEFYGHRKTRHWSWEKIEVYVSLSYNVFE